MSLATAELIYWIGLILCGTGLGYIVGRAGGRHKGIQLGRKQVLEEFPALKATS